MPGTLGATDTVVREDVPVIDVALIVATLSEVMILGGVTVCEVLEGGIAGDIRDEFVGW